MHAWWGGWNGWPICELVQQDNGKTPIDSSVGAPLSNRHVPLASPWSKNSLVEAITPTQWLIRRTWVGNGTWRWQKELPSHLKMRKKVIAAPRILVWSPTTILTRLSGAWLWLIGREAVFSPGYGRNQTAPTRNRTGGPSMATMDFTTKPSALSLIVSALSLICL